MESINIIELMRHCPRATVCLTISELGTFAKQLIAESRDEFERERIAAAQDKAELYLTSELVKEKLSISDSTLYRMCRAKILRPIWVGGQKRYRLSDIHKIVDEKNLI